MKLRIKFKVEHPILDTIVTGIGTLLLVISTYSVWQNDSHSPETWSITAITIVVASWFIFNVVYLTGINRNRFIIRNRATGKKSWVSAEDISNDYEPYSNNNPHSPSNSNSDSGGGD